MLLKQQYFALFITLFALSCRTVQVPTAVAYHDYRITDSLAKDARLIAMMAPYRDSVDRSMNAVVGYVESALEKKQPQGSLGNFMVDALYYGGKTKFGFEPDLAVVNYGGIRLTQVPAGKMTRGKVFELMPFDNLLVLQQIKGDVLKQFLDHTAVAGGWPLAGVSMEIRDKKAVNILIKGQPLDPNKTYNLINSDYVANGGDNAAMLKAIPQKNLGYLMRDAIFDYIASLPNKTISVNNEKRVTDAQ
jgi:2',3'-cyclic-nucleotide 2'-phosphodiesterase (5'-nucleotidase family)